MDEESQAATRNAACSTRKLKYKVPFHVLVQQPLYMFALGGF